jgi:hypothetical protein
MMENRKIIVAGGRYFTDYDKVQNELDWYAESIINGYDLEIVSGRCDRGALTFTTPEGIKVYGADGLGERYASEFKQFTIPVKLFPADWATYGNSAGYVRNLQMAEYATHLLAFWDGKSKGTGMMIRLANDKGLEVSIIEY